MMNNHKKEYSLVLTKLQILFNKETNQHKMQLNEAIIKLNRSMTGHACNIEVQLIPENYYKVNDIFLACILTT